jgi:hypothetical protein
MIMMPAVHMLTGMCFKGLLLLLESNEHASGLKEWRRKVQAVIIRIIVSQWHTCNTPVSGVTEKHARSIPAEAQPWAKRSHLICQSAAHLHEFGVVITKIL